MNILCQAVIHNNQGHNCRKNCPIYVFHTCKFYCNKVTSPLTVSTWLFSHKISQAYTNTSGDSTCPLYLPSQPMLASLGLKLNFSNTISPQRLNMRNTLIVYKPLPRG